MREQRLTERQGATLEHLKHAQELESTLSDYAAAFNLNVKDLYNGRTQLQRKGLWPKIRSAQAARPELLAVQVKGPPAPAANEDWVCRLRGPGDWKMECRRFPEASWLMQLSAVSGKADA